MLHLALLQHLVVFVDQADLVKRAAPVDTGNTWPAGSEGGLDVTMWTNDGSFEDLAPAARPASSEPHLGAPSLGWALLPLADSKPATVAGERVCIGTSKARVCIGSVRDGAGDHRDDLGGLIVDR
jgi:hypothetical protein